MRVCEARNWSLDQALQLTEEELVLILVHADIEADIRKREQEKAKKGRKSP